MNGTSLRLVAATAVLAIAVLYRFGTFDFDSAFLAWHGRGVSLSGAEFLGSPSASLVIIAFSDFECPSCARFGEETLPQLKRDFIDSNRLALAFRHFPLETIHPRAPEAAKASICAGRQQRFWQMHDFLFRDPDAHDRGSLFRYAERLGLSASSFEACLAESTTHAQLRDDYGQARRLGVKVTPTFLLGHRRSDGSVRVQRRIQGLLPYERLKSEIERLSGTPRNRVRPS